MTLFIITTVAGRQGPRPRYRHRLHGARFPIERREHRVRVLATADLGVPHDALPQPAIGAAQRRVDRFCPQALVVLRARSPHVFDTHVRMAARVDGPRITRVAEPLPIVLVAVAIDSILHERNRVPESPGVHAPFHHAAVRRRADDVKVRLFRAITVRPENRVQRTWFANSVPSLALDRVLPPVEIPVVHPIVGGLREVKGFPGRLRDAVEQLGDSDAPLYEPGPGICLA